jgi:hypothetical protein
VAGVLVYAGVRWKEPPYKLFHVRYHVLLTCGLGLGTYVVSNLDHFKLPPHINEIVRIVVTVICSFYLVLIWAYHYDKDNGTMAE